MSDTIRIPRTLLAALLAIIWTLPAEGLAGLAPAPVKQAQPETTLDEIDALSSGDRSTHYTLRCWQEGFLILERPLAALPPEAARSVELADDALAPMRLYDLRNAFCLVQ